MRKTEKYWLTSNGPRPSYMNAFIKSTFFSCHRRGRPEQTMKTKPPPESGHRSTQIEANERAHTKLLGVYLESHHGSHSSRFIYVTLLRISTHRTQPNSKSNCVSIRENEQTNMTMITFNNRASILCIPVFVCVFVCVMIHLPFASLTQSASLPVCPADNLFDLLMNTFIQFFYLLLQNSSFQRRFCVMLNVTERFAQSS